MTTPKRWYQLSMLQILVAMAVVAGLLVLNLKVRRVEVLGMWVAYASELEVHHFNLSSGWPFTAAEAQVPGTVWANALDDFRALQTARPLIRPAPLLGNIVVGVMIVVCIVLLVGNLTKRRTCPSP